MAKSGDYTHNPRPDTDETATPMIFAANSNWDPPKTCGTSTFPHLLSAVSTSAGASGSIKNQ
jgi:hypothetical protein